MAVLKNPMRDDLPDDVKHVFNQFSYSNFNGVQREVEFTGGEVRVEHGLGFAPDLSKLTVRVMIAFADIGQVWLTKSDERYVYVNAPRRGKARLEIAHPPRQET